MSGFGNEFDDLLNAMGGGRADRARQVMDRATKKIKEAEAKKAPPPQLRGKRLNDGYYVRADDLAALLNTRKVLPNLAASLRKKAES